MPRPLLCSALCAAIAGATLFAPAASAQGATAPDTLFEMPLPGGLAAAHAAIADPAPADRSHFVIEIIHRLHGVPANSKDTARRLSLESLFPVLERTARGAAPPVADTVPLPLAPAFWTETVFGGRATRETLALAILRSRSASLLYYGLLAVDDDTRAWLAGQTALLSEIASRASGAFAVAAPGLRIAHGTVRVPGGTPAEAAWEALIGARVTDPAAFVRAVVTNTNGRLAYFLAAISQLTAPQVAFALKLDAPDRAVSVEAARRLFAVFQRNASGWKQEERPLWRPPLDPALLVADLALDRDGRPNLPGSRRFWELAFAERADADPRGAVPTGRGTAGAEHPVDFIWICEQVFKGSQTVQRRPYEVVLFASRVIRNVPPESMRDLIEVVRAADTYPALFNALERARVSDVSVYARTARRAARLTAIENHARASRALAQFQGAVLMLTRAAARGSLTGDALARSLSSLADVELNDRGEYEGRLVRWLTGVISAQREAHSNGEADLDDDALGAFDERIVRLVSGPMAAARVVEWEGTRYRVDVARTEAARLRALLGQDAQPYASVAARLLSIADALSTGAGSPDQTRAQVDAMKALMEAIREDRPGEWAAGDAVARMKAAAAAFVGAAEHGNRAEATRIAAALPLISDDFLARGLVQLAYAIALGQPDRTLITAGDAASRHDFGLRLLGYGRLAAWRAPVSGTDRRRDWHITGSLLGLDLRLADLSLVSLSAKPPSLRPSLNEAARRVFIETAAIVQPAAFSDGDRDAMAGAMQKGRERLTAVRTPEEALAVADVIGLGPIRRSLLSWVAVYDPERLPTFLSLTELLWLGWGNAPIPDGFHSWGTSSAARIGCDCPQLLNRRSWESLAGRWDSGVPATAFADLNLRLTELLRELGMPAFLLANVLPAATLDFVNNATSRWHDDERGLVTFVQALPVERVEQFLSLLTSNGPLFPLTDGSDPPLTPAGQTEVSR